MPSFAVTVMFVGAAAHVFPLGKGPGRRLLRFSAIRLWSPPEHGSADLLSPDGPPKGYPDDEDLGPQVVDGILYGRPCEGAAITLRIGDVWLISDFGVGSPTGAGSSRLPLVV